MRRWLIRLIPLVYMSFIWYLSSKPSDAIVNTGLSYDAAFKEALHLFEFAGLYWLLVLAWLTRGELTPRANSWAMLLAIAYGCVDELHQYFVPFRSATVIDLVKDTAGVVIAWTIINQAFFRRPDSRLKTLLTWLTAAPRREHNQEF